MSLGLHPDRRRETVREPGQNLEVWITNAKFRAAEKGFYASSAPSGPANEYPKPLTVWIHSIDPSFALRFFMWVLIVRSLPSCVSPRHCPRQPSRLINAVHSCKVGEQLHSRAVRKQVYHPPIPHASSHRLSRYGHPFPTSGRSAFRHEVAQPV